MKKLLIVLLAALLLSGCEPTPKRFNAVFDDVFDTVTEFTAYCGTEEEFEVYRDELHSELVRLHEIFDIYNEYGGVVNAKTLNDSQGESVEVAPELYELILSAKKWEDLSGGKLNAALGSVLSLWHDCRESGELPDVDELKRRAKHCDFDNVVAEDGFVTLTDPEMSLDFGALAKGYAVQRCAELLEASGLENFAISCGGNVMTKGEKPTGKWEIGVEDPNGGLLTTLSVSDAAIVTSGDYQRYFEVDGVRYHHIIDPDTLYPAGKWRSVTVICPRSDDADALSTALFCLDQEDGRQLLKQFGAEAIWVSPDGEVTRSEGAKA